MLLYKTTQWETSGFCTLYSGISTNWRHWFTACWSVLMEWKLGKDTCNVTEKRKKRQLCQTTASTVPSSTEAGHVIWTKGAARQIVKKPSPFNCLKFLTNSKTCSVKQMFHSSVKWMFHTARLALKRMSCTEMNEVLSRILSPDVSIIWK